MLYEQETQDRNGSSGSHREGADLVAHQSSIASADAGGHVDALMHLSDVLMREMFAVSLSMNDNFARVAGGPAAGSAHTLIASLGQRIKELRAG